MSEIIRLKVTILREHLDWYRKTISLYKEVWLHKGSELKFKQDTSIIFWVL